MEESLLEYEIRQWKKKLKQIEGKYFTSVIKDWPMVRAEELSVIREIEKLKKKQRDNMLAKNMQIKSKEKEKNIESNNKESNITPKDNNKIHQIIERTNIIPKISSTNSVPHEENTDIIPRDEEQWDLNNKLLVEGYEVTYNISEDDLSLIDELAIEMMDQEECKHDWIRGKGDYNIKCAYRIYYPSQDNRFRMQPLFETSLCFMSQLKRAKMEIGNRSRI